MKRKAFSLVEILVAVIILAVLSSLSIVAYQKTLQANEERICQQNLKVLQAAVEVYTMENDAVPATLAMLTPGQIRLAYLKVVGQPQENKLLAFLKNTLGIKTALAQTPTELGKYYNYDAKVLKCPADKSTFAISYTINTSDFIDQDDLKDPAKASIALIYDSDAYHKKALSSKYSQITIGPTGPSGIKTFEGGTYIPSLSSGPFPTDVALIPPSSEEKDTALEDLITLTPEEIEEPETINDSTKCCKSDQLDWRKLRKKVKKACKRAGYRPPKKDGSPRGKCASS